MFLWDTGSFLFQQNTLWGPNDQNFAEEGGGELPESEAKVIEYICKHNFLSYCRKESTYVPNSKPITFILFWTGHRTHCHVLVYQRFPPKCTYRSQQTIPSKKITIQSSNIKQKKNPAEKRSNEILLVPITKKCKQVPKIKKTYTMTKFIYTMWEQKLLPQSSTKKTHFLQKNLLYTLKKNNLWN